MITTGMMIGWGVSLFMIAALTIVYVWSNSKQQDRHEEMKKALNDSANSSLEIAGSIGKVADAANEFNSLKRWMRETVEQLQQHSERLDAAVVENEGIMRINDIKTADVAELAAMIKAMDERGAVIVRDDLEDVAARMRGVVEIQGQTGNWDRDEYMRGMYNGMELMLSIVEKRSPEYKE